MLHGRSRPCSFMKRGYDCTTDFIPNFPPYSTTLNRRITYWNTYWPYKQSSLNFVQKHSCLDCSCHFWRHSTWNGRCQRSLNMRFFFFAKPTYRVRNEPFHSRTRLSPPKLIFSNKKKKTNKHILKKLFFLKTWRFIGCTYMNKRHLFKLG